MSIEQARANIEEMRNDMHHESRKFTVQLPAGASAAFAAGVGALGLVLHLMGRI